MNPSNKMQVNEINIVPVKPNNGLIAFVSFVIDNKFYVGNVAIFTRRDKQGQIRLVYPQKNNVNCIHPISHKTGETITNAVQKKYDEIFSENLIENLI